MAGDRCVRRDTPVRLCCEVIAVVRRSAHVPPPPVPVILCLCVVGWEGFSHDLQACSTGLLAVVALLRGRAQHLLVKLKVALTKPPHVSYPTQLAVTTSLSVCVSLTF